MTAETPVVGSAVGRFGQLACWLKADTLAAWAVLVAVASGPALWFRPGEVIFGVDSYFSLHPATDVAGRLFAWSASASLGQPNSQLPEVLFSALQAGLAHWLGTGLGQVVLLCILTTSSTLGMYFLATSFLVFIGFRSSHRTAAALAAAAWVVNPFALGFVWWHQLLIEVTWAGLPWLLGVLLVAATNRWSLAKLALLTLGVTWLMAAGLNEVYLPAISVLMLGMWLGVWGTTRVSASHAAKVGGIYYGAFLLGLAWWLLPSIQTIHSLLTTANIGGVPPDAYLRYASRFTSLVHVMTLTPLSELYATFDGAHYVSWWSLVESWPGVALLILFPALALLGIVLVGSQRKTRILAFCLLGLWVCGVLVAKGLNDPFPQLSVFVLHLPLGEAFRHPADKVAVLLAIPMCLGLAAVLARVARLPGGWRSLLAVGLIPVAILGSPWWTGEVIPTSTGSIPSGHVIVPHQYVTLARDLRSLPSGSKVLVLPYSSSGEAAFRWASGVQPNTNCVLQEWTPGKSVLCDASGAGTDVKVLATIVDGIENGDIRALDLARVVGVQTFVVHADWAEGYVPTVPETPVETAAFLSDPANLAVAAPGTNPGAVLRGGLVMRAVARPTTQFVVMRLGAFDLQVNRAASSSRGVFVSLYSRQLGIWWPGEVIRTNQWVRVSVGSRGGLLRFEVNGVSNGRPLRCISQSAGNCKWGYIGPAHLSQAQLDPVELISTTGVQLGSEKSQAAPELELGLHRVATGSYLDAWRLDGLQLIYSSAAVGLLRSDSSWSLLSAAARVADVRDPVLLPSVPKLHLTSIRDLRWTEHSPTAYEGSGVLRGETVLVFGQTFSSGWTLALNGRPVPARHHLLANGYANGWLVRGSGAIKWTLSYDPQTTFDVGLIAGAAEGAIVVLGTVYLTWLEVARRRKVRAA